MPIRLIVGGRITICTVVAVPTYVGVMLEPDVTARTLEGPIARRYKSCIGGLWKSSSPHQIRIGIPNRRQRVPEVVAA
jgi:hypothetical protein